MGSVYVAIVLLHFTELYLLNPSDEDIYFWSRHQAYVGIPY